MKEIKNVTAYRIAKRLGRNPANIYRIKNGKIKCPILLAGTIDLTARAIAMDLDLPQKCVKGWRLCDLRPDIIEMVQACLQADGWVPARPGKLYLDKA